MAEIIGGEPGTRQKTAGGDQKTDNDQGMSPNMTFKTQSKSPKTTGAPAWRDDSDNSEDDNNGFNGRVKSTKRNAG